MNSDESLSRLPKRNAIIRAIEEAAIENECNWLEVAEATKAVLVCACTYMGVNVQDILGEEVKPDAMLVVQEEDALD